MSNSWALVIVIVLTLIMVFRIVLNESDQQPRAKEKLGYRYDVPEVDAVAAYVLLNKQQPADKAFTARLTDLAMQHKIKIAKGNKTNRNIKYENNNYNFTILAKDSAPEKLDSLLMTILKMGDGKTVAVKEFQNQKFNPAMRKWQKQEMQKISGQGLLSGEDVANFTRSFALEAYLSGILSIALGLATFGSLTSLAIFVLAVIQFMMPKMTKDNTSFYSARGVLAVEQVRSFEKTIVSIITDPDHFSYQKLDLSKALPYMIVLDLSVPFMKRAEELHWELPQFRRSRYA